MRNADSHSLRMCGGRYAAHGHWGQGCAVLLCRVGTVCCGVCFPGDTFTRRTRVAALFRGVVGFITMEIPGCDFEDSVFSEPRERAAGSGEPYSARQCEPQWFYEDASEDCVDIPTAQKFKGDLAYKQEDFEKALCEFNTGFLLLPPSNTAMRRDVLESRSRCLLHLGRHTEALEIVAILKKGVSNTDHLTCALNLQLTIYSRLGNLLKAISCLQQLISLHPCNPWIWKRLAESYMGLSLAAPGVLTCRTSSEGLNSFNLGIESLSVNEYTSTTDREKHRGEPCCLNHFVKSKDTISCSDHTAQQGIVRRTAEESDKPLLEKCTKREELLMNACASFIRARLLLQLVQHQQASFVLENNLKAQEDIEEQLNIFGLKEQTQMLMTEVSLFLLHMAAFLSEDHFGIVRT
ncbi:hypothetical protein FKM82_014307 [Ascaphus truei]